MKGSFLLIAGTVFAVLGVAGCAHQSKCGCEENNAPEIKAVYTSKPIVLDGKLDDVAWKDAPAYVPVFSRRNFEKAHPDIKNFFKDGVTDPGTFKLLWDDKYLYVGILFIDKDIVAEGDADQLVHCSLGDLAEVFLKPAKDTYYWELYVTPQNKKTAFFYSGRGCHGLPSCLPKEIPLKKMATAVTFKGTLNNSFDKDEYWSAEIAIPIDEINARGIKLAPGVPWKILLARYNYSRYVPVKELTAYPELEIHEFPCQRGIRKSGSGEVRLFHQSRSV